MSNEYLVIGIDGKSCQVVFATMPLPDRDRREMVTVALAGISKLARTETINYLIFIQNDKVIGEATINLDRDDYECYSRWDPKQIHVVLKDNDVFIN